MKTSIMFLRWTALMAGNLILLAGCVHGGEGSSTFLLATNAPSKTNSLKMTQQSKNNEDEREAELREALEYSAKQAENRAHGIPPPPSQYPFPNYDTGPLRPYPIHLNFYAMDDCYTNYLLCQYDVDTKDYNQSDEPKWFKASLEQVRELGSKKFPPIKWIAVIVVNRAGWNGASTFEQAHKVGAIFKASDVFDSSQKLSQLIADASMDRHPFKYDTTQPTPGEQQRWLIVEQHAATNSPATGSK